MSLLKNKVAIRKRFVVTLLLLVLLVMPIVAVKSNVNADTFGVFNYNISYQNEQVPLIKVSLLDYIRMRVPLQPFDTTPVEFPHQYRHYATTYVQEACFLQFLLNFLLPHLLFSVQDNLHLLQ